VVVLAINPNFIGKRRPHAASAATAVASVASGCHEFLVSFVGDLGEVGIRAFQLTFSGVFGLRGWRSGRGAALRWRILFHGVYRLLCVIGGERSGADKIDTKHDEECKWSKKHWGTSVSSFSQSSPSRSPQCFLRLFPRIINRAACSGK